MKRNKLIFAVFTLIISIDLAFADNYIVHFGVILTLALASILIRRELSIDPGDVLIFLGMFTFSWFQDYSLFNAAKWSVGVTAVYELGKSIVLINKKHHNECCVIVITSISLMLFARGILNYSQRIGSDYTWSHWPMFGGGMIPRTQHEFFMIMMSSLLVFWLISIKH